MESSPEERLRLVRLIIGHRQGETRIPAALSMRRVFFVVAVGVAIFMICGDKTLPSPEIVMS